MSEYPAGYVSDELYSQVTATFPVICVDVIPFDAATNRIGVITRATGQEAGGLAMIGGRIQKDESVEKAIKRHLLNDLQIKDFSFYTGNTAARPFYVQQYFHGNAPKGELKGYDPSKHSIGLTYIIEIKGTAQPKAEAASFHWIDESGIPETGAYCQGLVMRQAYVFLAKTKNSPHGL